MGNQITLEHIKDIIIEAYSQVDAFKRDQLLEQADDLEHQLVAAYREKGLRQTASNIAHSLEILKKNHFGKKRW